MSILSLLRKALRAFHLRRGRKQQAKESVKVVHQNFFSQLNPIDVFLVGCGTVGAELLGQIEKQQASLPQRNISLRVFGIANSRQLLLKPVLNLPMAGNLNLSKQLTNLI